VSSVLDPSLLSGSRPPRPRRSDLVGFLVLALGLGAVAGVVWWWVVDLPGYLVDRDGRASTSERGLADFVGGDAWFTLLGAVTSLLLGWIAWVWLRQLGWPLVLLTVGAALAAALVCWLVGYLLGPDDFTRRMAQSQPGDLVLIQLTIRAKASLLVWPFAAVVPVLLGSSLGRDDEEPQPRDRQPRARRPGDVSRRLSQLSLRRPGRRRRSAPPEPT
jgi:hypothetical protein